MKDRASYPSEQADKFLLRLPDGMRERVAAAAKSNGRSMNAEIVARLHRSLTMQDEISLERYDKYATRLDLLLERMIRVLQKQTNEPLPKELTDFLNKSSS